eukprot:gnl/MRDRNA2_/MRDRNA2_31595_c0_seq1.p1 gnl/MRDRNA2_/MRDRNA2_31595_c0~~gnl/MRDRNA2_/MRDRNA2_31595_c0_seq1.p1  ORF type:complete len:127 (+),score=20.44 gnl/MRDRNA2_/MRDRNA2_31595_c0_seq1:71-451(+)
MSSTAASSTEASPPPPHPNHPKDVCGAQWLLLWTTAVYSPETPTPEERANLQTFFGKFQEQCREGPHADCFKQAQEAGLPNFTSRRELLTWLCIEENKCLKKAGLPLKQCRYNKLMERWRYPDGYL